MRFYIQRTKTTMTEELPEELRFYAFTNFYLSAIQHGIQAFHAQHEMYIKYDNTGYPPGKVPITTLSDWENTGARKMLYDWARQHKTMITLSAGANAGLHDMRSLVSAAAATHELPWSFFHEDNASLGGILTCVAIVLPSKVFDAIPLEDGSCAHLASQTSYAAESDIAKFIVAMKRCSLAR